MRVSSRLLALLAFAVAPLAGAAAPAPIVIVALTAHGGPLIGLDETGRRTVALTGPTSVVDSFSWSADGTRIVYADRSDGDLHIVGLDGGGVTTLTVDGENGSPAWSPDGSRIAYFRTVRVPEPFAGVRRNMDVWLIPSSGGSPTRLTATGGEKLSLAWAPDGTRLLYSTSTETVVLDPDTGRVLRAFHGHGTWSPDGARIAIGSSSGLDVVEPDGTGRVTVAAHRAADPVWSPDGRSIAFVRFSCSFICRHEDDAVYTVDADGRNERLLTWRFAYGFDAGSSPSWWPDGSRLLFQRSRLLYAMNSDGTCEQPFGHAERSVVSPVWRPGTTVSAQPFRCVELRTRSSLRGGDGSGQLGLRDTARFRVTIENDGNETAHGLKVTLRVTGGDRVLVPPSCRSGRSIVCRLPPLAPGASAGVAVAISRLRPGMHPIVAYATAEEPDADPRLGSVRPRIWVLDCDIVGSYRKHQLRGTASRDTLCAHGTDDDIRAGAGDDTVKAEQGDDRILPGPGRDVVWAGDGDDWIDARDGEEDVIHCGAGRDTVLADRVDRLGKCEHVLRR